MGLLLLNCTNKWFMVYIQYENTYIIVIYDIKCN